MIRFISYISSVTECFKCAQMHEKVPIRELSSLITVLRAKILRMNAMQADPVMYSPGPSNAEAWLLHFRS